MSRTYRASLLTASNIIELRDLSMSPLADGEIRLRVAFAGICGTDVSIFSGDYPVSLPLTLGHEFSGAVVKVADKAHEHLVGKRVVGEINNSCTAYGRTTFCTACQRGLPTHCLARTVTGIIDHPGAFADYLTIPVGNAHILPDEIPLDQAVLIEPLAAAIRTFELSPVRQGDTVVVLGCGRLGRLIALVAKKMGARVIAVGRTAKQFTLMPDDVDVRVAYQRQEAVEDSEFVTSPAELRSLVCDHTDGLGADIVVEATGSNENLGLAQQLVRPLGTVAMKSTCGRPVSTLDTTYSAVHEIRFQGSRCGPFDKAIEFMIEHGQPTKEWITSRYRLEDLPSAIEAARTEAKVIVDMGATL